MVIGLFEFDSIELELTIPMLVELSTAIDIENSARLELLGVDLVESIDKGAIFGITTTTKR